MANNDLMIEWHSAEGLQQRYVLPHLNAEMVDIFSKLLEAVVTYIHATTHHKPKASLQVDISDATVSFEEPLHVLFSGRGAQPTDEDTTSTHFDVCLKK